MYVKVIYRLQAFFYTDKRVAWSICHNRASFVWEISLIQPTVWKHWRNKISLLAYLICSTAKNNWRSVTDHVENGELRTLRYNTAIDCNSWAAVKVEAVTITAEMVRQHVHPSTLSHSKQSTSMNHYNNHSTLQHSNQLSRSLDHYQHSYVNLHLHDFFIYYSE